MGSPGAGDSSSDDDVVAPSRVRPSFKKDPLSTSRASPIVTAAARRQLRGGSPDQKSAAEIAAEYRRKLNETSISPEAKKPISSVSPPPRNENKSFQSPSPEKVAPTKPVEQQPIVQSVVPPPMQAANQVHEIRAAELPKPAPAKTPEPRKEAAPAPANVAEQQHAAADQGGEKERPRLVIVTRRTAVGMGLGAEGKVGIGIRFVPNEDGDMIVTSLLDGGPAYETNKRDVIVAVNDTNVNGKPSDKVQKLIIGEPGTNVQLLLRKSKASAASSPSPGPAPARATKHAVAATPERERIEPIAPMTTPQQGIQQSPPPAAGVEHTPTQGPRAGIGIKFGIDKHDRVSVLDILPGSPADESKKLKPANRIVAVNGSNLSGKNATEIEQLISGPAGTSVVLTIRPTLDADEAATSTVHLTRKVNVTPKKPTHAEATREAQASTAGHEGAVAQSSMAAAGAVVSPGGTMTAVQEPAVSLEKFNAFQRNMNSRLDQIENTVKQQHLAIAANKKTLQTQEKALQTAQDQISKIENRKPRMCVIM